jgi:hypothetical protein
MDEASAHVLLAQLHTSANLHGQSKDQNTNLPPALENDLVASLGMLKSAYPQLRSPQLRFDIDKIMLMARRELGFSSAVGPVATLLTIPRPEQHYASEAGRLTREYEYATGRDTRGRQFEIELIAQDLSTHRRFIIGPRERIDGGMSGGSGSLVPLPPDLPRARYHLFYQAYENGKPVGEGQGVDVDLPPPSTQPTSRGTTTRATTLTTIPSSSR